MSAFNLVAEPWIPVRWLDGRRSEVGIRECLQRGNEIGLIEDQSPLVVAALHRLLLAVLYRALAGPTDIDGARHLFQTGIPIEELDRYLDQWHSRFWLFDDAAPFWQVARFEPKEWRAWTVLAAEHNADNAKVLFDHTSTENAGAITAAHAARWLVATQTFAVSAGKSELSHTSSAPVAKNLVVIPVGATLAETLIFMMVPQNAAVTAGDHAVWERPEENIELLKAKPERAAAGIADLYTWRTRSIRLRATESGVERVAFASGIALVSGELIDPMTPYRMDEKRGRLPIQMRDRGLWRDLDSLLPDSGGLAPVVVAHAARLAEREPMRKPRALLALGQSTDQAKVEFWRAERFTLPAHLASDGASRVHLRMFLDDAERSRGALAAAARTFARHVLSRGARVPMGGDLTSFVDQLSVERTYWSRLEERFHELLRRYDGSSLSETRCYWLDSIGRTLRACWATVQEEVAFGDAWAMRALARAEPAIGAELTRLVAEIETQQVKESDP